MKFSPMAVLLLSNLPSAANAFVSMQFSLVGAKQVVGGTALAMASSVLTIKRALSGKLRQLRSELLPHLNSNAMKQQDSGLLGRFKP